MIFPSATLVFCTEQTQNADFPPCASHHLTEKCIPNKAEPKLCSSSLAVLVEQEISGHGERGCVIHAQISPSFTWNS